MAPLNAGGKLSELLRESMIESKFDKTRSDFVPQGVSDLIISKESIKGAMNITLPTDDALVDFICLRALKVFAIMAFLEPKKKLLRNAMSWFYEKRFDDEMLPIEKWAGKRYRENLERGKLHPFVAMEGPVEDEDDRFWTYGKIYDFQEKQFSFLAPVLSTQKSNHDTWDLIMPFIAKEASYAEGSFGMVSKYRIHCDHILDPSTANAPPPLVVAVKEIKVDNEADRQKVARNWASEVKAMAVMNDLNHKGHIVRFITAFRRGTPEDPEHYLITEWADGGNLHDLWKATPKPKFTAPRVHEVITQLLGLAEALNAAHFLKDGGVYSGASYRHGDLKPANILWFTDGDKLGTLKICDWGCAKNKDVATALRHSKTSSEYGTRRYEPPEIATGVGTMLPGSEEMRISRLYDIWSIGCITLEFVVWLLYGLEGLEKFNKSVRGEMTENPPFYQLSEVGGENVGVVHNIATYWMNHMAQDPACRVGTTALGDLLEIVQGGLLVVKLPREGGTFVEGSFQASRMNPGRAHPDRQVNDDMSNDSAPQGTSVAEETFSGSVPGISITPAEPSEHDMRPHFVTAGPARLRANQLRDRLYHIVTADEGESYWSIKPERPVPDIPSNLYSDKSTPGLLRRPVQEEVDYGHPKLDPNNWEFETDVKFAAQVFSSFKDIDQYPVAETRISSKLCDQCESFRDGLWDTLFEISYDLRGLETRANTCDLCALLWKTCERTQSTMFGKARFARFGSSLRMNGNHLPVLSISRSPDCNSPAAADLQVGFAELPAAGSKMHLEVVRNWLKDCDEKHSTSTCRPAQRGGEGAPVRLPTRLIDVGTGDDDTVRVQETNSQDFVSQDTAGWLALSHQWGPKPHFSTTTGNIDEHLTGIKLASLPATFKDAVLVTRALGRRYLWIDSICIIQEGIKADFEQEGKRMEDVYSGAYCVIAATSSTGHSSGFLKPRKRDWVALRREIKSEAPFYVCQRIDNFKEHVLDGALNSRGWVLQEHALARRTIFFAEHQTYWECGHGVRCETMTKLRNESAQLLGDPNFPQILDSAPHGERIIRFQELYQIYSRLGLTRASDRPRAINGLEQRLLHAMNVKGGFGMFQSAALKGLLCRSLLWHRGFDAPSLSRIPRITVPSWSWMAYAGGKDAMGKDYPGGINYFKLKFKGFDWEDFESPWSRSDKDELDHTLIAKVRGFNRSAARTGEDHLVFDTPADTDRHNAKCVVLGIQSGTMNLNDRRHYVLVVVPTDRFDEKNSRVYERVGAGYLPGRCFTQDDAVLASIQ